MKQLIQIFGLLIEPVWNRNEDILNQLGAIIKLLIEPVWNRNMHEKSQSQVFHFFF